MFLWVKAFHIIAMVAWFAGLFYLPRLFVYHVEINDEPGLERFEIMERRLYYAIMWPAAVTTTLLGLWLLFSSPSYYLHAPWMHAKLSLVILLWMFHWLCGRYRKKFLLRCNTHSQRFYRFFNEIPTLLLIAIVCLVTVK